MTKQDRIDMNHEAEAYAEKYKTANPQEQSLIALAYLDGIKHGLKQHAHDYLVKTIGLKRKHEEQIEKMKCCGNCLHCKYDLNEESNEYCEKHQRIVNIAVQPCPEYEYWNWSR